MTIDRFSQNYAYTFLLFCLWQLGVAAGIAGQGCPVRFTGQGGRNEYQAILCGSGSWDIRTKHGALIDVLCPPDHLSEDGIVWAAERAAALP